MHDFQDDSKSQPYALEKTPYEREEHNDAYRKGDDDKPFLLFLNAVCLLIVRFHTQTPLSLYSSKWNFVYDPYHSLIYIVLKYCDNFHNNCDRAMNKVLQMFVRIKACVRWLPIEFPLLLPLLVIQFTQSVFLYKIFTQSGQTVYNPVIHWD